MANDLLSNPGERGLLEVVRESGSTHSVVRNMVPKGPISRADECTGLLQTGLNQCARNQGQIERAEHATIVVTLDVQQTFPSQGHDPSQMDVIETRFMLVDLADTQRLSQDPNMLRQTVRPSRRLLDQPCTSAPSSRHPITPHGLIGLILRAPHR